MLDRPMCTKVSGKQSCNGRKNQNASRRKRGFAAIATARWKKHACTQPETVASQCAFLLS